MGQSLAGNVRNWLPRMDKVAGMMDGSLDEDRDPKRITNNLQIPWQEVIAEPPDIRSPECAWRVSTQCFQLSRNFCYILLSVMIAPFYALCLGCTFACLAFKHIWCVTPCLRAWRVTCLSTRSCMQGFSNAILAPICFGFGHFWSNIRLRTRSALADDDHRDEIMMI